MFLTAKDETPAWEELPVLLYHPLIRYKTNFDILKTKVEFVCDSMMWVPKTFNNQVAGKSFLKIQGDWFLSRDNLFVFLFFLNKNTWLEFAV